MVCANVAIALGILTTESLKETVRQCKMKKTRRIAIKMMKERKAALASRTAPEAGVTARPLNSPLSIIEEEPEEPEEQELSSIPHKKAKKSKGKRAHKKVKKNTK